MRTRSRRKPAGISLVEAMVAIGVLAVVIPLAMAALAKAGDIGSSARAETRAPTIAERCLGELEAARQGDSFHFEPLAAGQAFPAGGVWALAFDPDGELLGKLSAAQYEQGLARIGGAEVGYVARLSGSRVDVEPEDVLTITVQVEYPAAQPASRRDVLAFHTKLP